MKRFKSCRWNQWGMMIPEIYHHLRLIKVATLIKTWKFSYSQDGDEVELIDWFPEPSLVLGLWQFSPVIYEVRVFFFFDPLIIILPHFSLQDLKVWSVMTRSKHLLHSKFGKSWMILMNSWKWQSRFPLPGLFESNRIKVMRFIHAKSFNPNRTIQARTMRSVINFS